MHRRRDGAPSWFVFLLGMALIFGIFYLWSNLRDFLQTGGLSVAEATRRSELQITATQEQRVVLEAELPTRRPTSTPRPPCLDFEVTAASGIMRQQPSTAAPFIESIPQGSVVCVLSYEDIPDGFRWYLIDRDPITRRIEVGYMREDILRPVNPTPTPSDTPLPAPTITPLPTNTPRPTLDESAASTNQAEATATPTVPIRPTVTPLPTDTPVGIGV